MSKAYFRAISDDKFVQCSHDHPTVERKVEGLKAGKTYSCDGVTDSGGHSIERGQSYHKVSDMKKYGNKRLAAPNPRRYCDACWNKIKERFSL